jgi:hypothetical protein
MSNETGSLPGPKKRKDATFILNSFQTPNDYVDQFMYLLTGDEWKVLSYTVRRIFGFHEREDCVSLTQYQFGIASEDGARLDFGTGLSRPTIVKALAYLIKVNLIILVAPNDPRVDEGARYALQLDASKVDMAELLRRAEERRQINLNRTEKARLASPRSGKRHTHTDLSRLSDSGKSHLPGSAPTAVSPTYQSRSVPLTNGGKSHLHTKISKKSRGNPDTHTPHPPRAPEHPPPQGDVCVCESIEHDDYVDFAKSKSSFTEPEAWAAVHWPIRHKEHHICKQVHEWKQRRQAALDGKVEEKPKRTPFHAAAQAVNSVAQVPGYDVRGFIEQLTDVDEETRARLFEQFCPPEPASAARAP